MTDEPEATSQEIARDLAKLSEMPAVSNDITTTVAFEIRRHNIYILGHSEHARATDERNFTTPNANSSANSRMPLHSARQVRIALYRGRTPVATPSE